VAFQVPFKASSRDKRSLLTLNNNPKALPVPRNASLLLNPNHDIFNGSIGVDCKWFIIRHYPVPVNGPNLESY
jgi:hypothetical protein